MRRERERDSESCWQGRGRETTNDNNSDREIERARRRGRDRETERQSDSVVRTQRARPAAADRCLASAASLRRRRIEATDPAARPRRTRRPDVSALECSQVLAPRPLLARSLPAPCPLLARSSPAPCPLALARWPGRRCWLACCRCRPAVALFCAAPSAAALRGLSLLACC